MTQNNSSPEVKLKRVLSLSDLIIYGIILIQPVAALPLFGHVNNISKGHAVTTILLAMVAMIFTAISYGRMANKYPVAGSAYTYVGKGLHPYVGFITGWSMFMDYMFIPILCVIFSSVTANHLMPYIPYYFWIMFFTAGFSYLNLRGIKVASRANLIMMIVMSVVVFYFIAAAVRYVFVENSVGALFTTAPFYNPDTFSFSAIGSATALAALTYIGFDGLTTLSEEVENPKRNVMIAVVLTCLITGVWSGAQIYLAQVSWPAWNSFANGAVGETENNHSLDTAIMAVANRVGGKGLDASLAITLLIGSIGSGITGQMGAGRLLYGMGRDNILPQNFFGHLDKKSAIPNYNVMLIGGLTLIGAIFFNYEDCALLINFGAFLAFMGVNLATIREYYFKGDKATLRSFLIDFLLPAMGFVVCLIIWLNLPLKTFGIGGSWLLAGGLYLLIKTKGFRKGVNN
ncbi:MAG TPA: APC family permease [Chryseolinea sp.]|nr:APC family permease [Chryseolinea sp.]